MNVADQWMLLEHTTSIVAAYVSNNTIQKEHLAALIADVFTSLAGANRAEPEPEALTPAVPDRRSAADWHDPPRANCSRDLRGIVRPLGGEGCRHHRRADRPVLKGKLPIAWFRDRQSRGDFGHSPSGVK